MTILYLKALLAIAPSLLALAFIARQRTGDSALWPIAGEAALVIIGAPIHQLCSRTATRT